MRHHCISPETLASLDHRAAGVTHEGFAQVSFSGVMVADQRFAQACRKRQMVSRSSCRCL